MSERMPASRQLLNITKAALDSAEQECLTIRNATIEDCALELEKLDTEMGNDNFYYRALSIKRVRALKDKE